MNKKIHLILAIIVTIIAAIITVMHWDFYISNDYKTFSDIQISWKLLMGNIISVMLAGMLWETYIKKSRIKC